MINFGGNVRFTPRHLYAPTSEQEVLAILDRHVYGKVRAVGALHSWSPAVVCDDALVDLRHFDGVSIERRGDEVWATVGAGCRIKELLRKLHELGDVTMPSLGLITEQTIAGAIATGTHGSGKHSLSHYVDELRVAAYDASGKACIYTWNEGDALRAARCALGCMGLILAVRLRCVRRFDVAETVVPCATLDEVLAAERDFPLQQFYLLPHRWTYFAQRRQVAPSFRPRRTWSARLYRAYWYLGIDLGLHLVIKLLVSILKSPALIRFFYRHVLSKFILTNCTVTDHSNRMLIMEHELFQHLEIELFVPARHLRAAAAFVREVVAVFAGTATGADEELRQWRGSFTHHYAITFRRVLPDDTLISMASGREEPYYAISFITYSWPREPFCALALFLARSMTRLYAARLHWG